MESNLHANTQLKDIKPPVLGVRGVELLVHLGCLPEERKEPQLVRYEIFFLFNHLPNGMFTDELTETICYAKVVEILKQAVLDKEFHLIEKLGTDSFLELKKEFKDKDVKIRMHICKVAPPIKEVRTGTTFELSEF